MPRVAVVIPWRGGCRHRGRALNWVLDRYEEHHPGWTILVSPGPYPWCKGIPVAAAVTAAVHADLLVIADADVWSDGLAATVEAVADGAPWGMPHTLVRRLSTTATERLISQGVGDEFDEPPYPGMPGGGLVVLRRPDYLQAPIDPRFIGWGQEDESWAIALTCILGEPYRGASDLVHLWHPPQARVSRTRGNADGWRLRRRYCKARADPIAMCSLLEEAQRALEPAQPPLHDHHAHSVR